MHFDLTPVLLVGYTWERAIWRQDRLFYAHRPNLAAPGSSVHRS